MLIMEDEGKCGEMMVAAGVLALGISFHARTQQFAIPLQARSVCLLALPAEHLG